MTPAHERVIGWKALAVVGVVALVFAAVLFAQSREQSADASAGVE